MSVACHAHCCGQDKGSGAHPHHVGPLQSSTTLASSLLRKLPQGPGASPGAAQAGSGFSSSPKLHMPRPACPWLQLWPPATPLPSLVLPMVLKYAHQNLLPRAFWGKTPRPPPRPDQGLDMNGLPTGLPRSRPGKRRLLHTCCAGQGGPQGQQAELTPVLLLSRPVSPSATARCGWTPAPRPSAASWRPPWAGPGLSAASPAPAPTR